MDEVTGYRSSGDEHDSDVDGRNSGDPFLNAAVARPPSRKIRKFSIQIQNNVEWRFSFYRSKISNWDLK